MNSKRVFYIMIVVVVLLVAAILGGTYVASQQLQKQSAQLQDYKNQDQVLSREETGLIKAKKDVATYSQLEKIAKSVVPQDKNQAQAVREIINIAAEAGIKPTAINFPTSNLGSPVAGAAAGTTATPVPATGRIPSQLTPVKGIGGVYNLQIIIQQDATAPVPYTKFIDFLDRLEKNRRTAQVSGIVLQPSALNHNLVSFTLTLEEFIKP